jgi:hypothetical protein
MCLCGYQRRYWRCRHKMSCPAGNPQPIPSGRFRHARMPDKVTVQCSRYPSSTEPITTVNTKAEMRQAYVSVHSWRTVLRNVAVWWLAGLLLIPDVRKQQLSPTEVSRRFPVSLQTDFFKVPQNKRSSFPSLSLQFTIYYPSCTLPY